VFSRALFGILGLSVQFSNFAIITKKSKINTEGAHKKESGQENCGHDDFDFHLTLMYLCYPNGQRRRFSLVDGKKMETQ
jgi:hypothetical protein